MFSSLFKNTNSLTPEVKAYRIVTKFVSDSIISIENVGELFDISFDFRNTLRLFAYKNEDKLSYEELNVMISIINPAYFGGGKHYLINGPVMRRRYPQDVRSRSYMFNINFLFLCDKILSSLKQIMRYNFLPFQIPEYKDWKIRFSKTEDLHKIMTVFSKSGYLLIKDKILEHLSWYYLPILQSMLVIVGGFLKSKISDDGHYFMGSSDGTFSLEVLYNRCIYEVVGYTNLCICFTGQYFVSFLKLFYNFSVLNNNIDSNMTPRDNVIALSYLVLLCGKINACQKYQMIEMFMNHHVTINSHNFGKPNFGDDIKNHILSFLVGDEKEDKEIVKKYAYK